MLVWNLVPALPGPSDCGLSCVVCLAWWYRTVFFAVTQIDDHANRVSRYTPGIEWDGIDVVRVTRSYTAMDA
jgi:hypothetical protein